MSGKVIAVIAACLLGVVAVVLLINRESNSFSASISIQSGTPGEGGLTSSLRCDGSSASGSGLFAKQQAAQKGCRAAQQVKEQLQKPQAACPARSDSGRSVYKVTGQVEGKPVKYQSFASTCSQRLNQFAKLSPLIKSMQAQIQPPTIQVMISPPPPPDLTQEDVDRAERLIRKLGMKGYQKYVERTSKVPKKPSKGIKPCPKPLPKDFILACTITIQPRDGETIPQALKRVKARNPEWFRNDGPNTPPLPQPPRR